ncbi:hypothetical protein, partial [Escherichia coli]|uniref:hypothetical protein n=1 Tax=Escherichia coli TaxID=562 RepID=UPI0003EF3D6A
CQLNNTSPSIRPSLYAYGKSDVRIIDFVDTAYPVLLRMWDKRQRGYKAMGYRIIADGDESVI